MKFRYFVLLMLCGAAIAQVQTRWECPDRSKQGRERIRVSDGVTHSLATQSPLPDVSDLQGQKLDSVVVVGILISTSGEVICTSPISGSPDLFKRSQETALKWRFKPYEIQGVYMDVETRIQFQYKKGKVKIVVPNR
jgi:hypothetical protein